MTRTMNIKMANTRQYKSLPWQYSMSGGWTHCLTTGLAFLPWGHYGWNRDLSAMGWLFQSNEPFNLRGVTLVLFPELSVFDLQQFSSPKPIKNPRSWTHNSEQQFDMKKTVRIKLDNIWHNFKNGKKDASTHRWRGSLRRVLFHLLFFLIGGAI